MYVFIQYTRNTKIYTCKYTKAILSKIFTVTSLSPQDLEELKQVEEKAKENVASKRLGKRIDSMLKEIDDTLRDLENEVLTLPDGKIDKDE